MKEKKQLSANKLNFLAELEKVLSRDTFFKADSRRNSLNACWCA